MFLILMMCIMSTFVTAMNPALMAAAASTTTTNNAKIASLKAENCIVDNLPNDICSDYRQRSSCIYDCKEEEGIKTFTINYRDGSVSTSFLTYEEIKEYQKYNDLMFWAFSIFCIILIIVFVIMSVKNR